MFENEEYLPKSREYFRKFRSSNLEDILDDVRECRTGPGNGYSHFHRDNEIIDCLRNIYGILEDQFSDLSIPGSKFTSPENLVQTWINFKDYLESHGDIFSEAAAKCNEEARNNPNVSDHLPFPLTQANSIRLKVLDVLDHILRMEEVAKYTSKTNNSLNVNHEPATSTEGPAMNKTVKWAVSISTIGAFVFAIWVYIHPNKTNGTSPNQQPASPATIQITNSPGANVVNASSGNTNVSEHINNDKNSKPTSNRKTEKKGHYASAMNDTEKIANLKSQYLQLYSTIDLCNAEDRQSDVPRYRHAYALMQEIKVLAGKTNDPAIITWIKKETCDELQDTGGIAHYPNR